MKPLRKAIFPIAGTGTRFFPATKTVPKEMLTIVDKPLIHYAVDEAIASGCTTLIFITGIHQDIVRNYFGCHQALEIELAKQNKHDALKLIQNILPDHVQCIYVQQTATVGLGAAIVSAAHLIENEPFAVILPDDLIDHYPLQPCLQQMAQACETLAANILAIEEVPAERLSQYGVIQPLHTLAGPMKIANIIEKPALHEAPSSLAVVGRYILFPEVMQALLMLHKEHRQPNIELQLTHALASVLKDSAIYGLPFAGKRFDCGSKEGFVQANLHYAIRKNII